MLKGFLKVQLKGMGQSITKVNKTAVIFWGLVVSEGESPGLRTSNRPILHAPPSIQLRILGRWLFGGKT